MLISFWREGAWKVLIDDGLHGLVQGLRIEEKREEFEVHNVHHGGTATAEEARGSRVEMTGRDAV